MKVSLTPGLQLPSPQELRTRLEQLDQETEAVKKMLRLAVRFERQSKQRPDQQPAAPRPEAQTAHA